MVSAFLRTVIGRYGGAPVGAPFFSQVAHAYHSGARVTETRRGLRSTGFTFPNQAVTEIYAELRRIEAAERGLNSLRMDARPGRRTLTPVSRYFDTRYHYTAQVRLRGVPEGVRDSYPVEFGSDRLMTREEIIARAESIVEQAVNTAINEGCMEEGAAFETRLTGALEGR